MKEQNRLILAEDHRSSDLGVTFCFCCVLF